ncbi:MULTISPECIES: DUF4190 domain-containing protein [unclassified Nocardia]|uniref:DUF4190 domain-containing protein n=1 Tax=unclassified Nocardia TaxID=2637762 RepID=UPI00261B94A1|nr:MULTISPECIES: DUF4190 domain-containing protein [unclassified Nocardia]MCU1639756.1 hypothetical protein [Nocardia sp.]WSJ16716.1 DUF4190 domain-containing protein [Nocardia sp. NBC_01327]
MVIPQQPIGAPTEHEYATAVLIMGALSVFCCGALGPVAWVMGRRALNEIEASGGAYGGRVQVVVGYVLGIVGTIFMVLFGILFLMMVVSGRA